MSHSLQKVRWAQPEGQGPPQKGEGFGSMSEGWRQTCLLLRMVFLFLFCFLRKT